jgi:hypothetical protein
MNDNHYRSLSTIARSLSALYAASFLFFLLYSAPHRVHHFFDQVQPASHANSSHHHDENDRRDSAPNAADCVFQAAANRCADGLGAEFEPLATVWHRRAVVVPLDHQYPHPFVSASFQSRAPPIA